ncbi:hypothetical protein MMC24_000787 [Lignoscripta atroalba]|nr:hypothetical protein [Lignoscripta atroalba]
MIPAKSTEAKRFNKKPDPPAPALKPPHPDSSLIYACFALQHNIFHESAYDRIESLGHRLGLDRCRELLLTIILGFLNTYWISLFLLIATQAQMEDPGDTYAPQSPDLSAYQNSSSAPDQAPYYMQQPSYQPGYQQSLHYNTSSPFLNQLPSQTLNPLPPRSMRQNGRTKMVTDDDEWTPEPSIQKTGRKSKKQKIEEDFGKPAPGVEEGIEVKTKFPVARIKRIMQADEDVGKVAQVTPTAVSKALELFMISLVTKAAKEAKAKSSKRVTAAHLKQVVEKDEQFDFLAETVAKVPDAPAPKKDEDSEEAGEGKKRKGGTRKRRKDSDDF